MGTAEMLTTNLQQLLIHEVEKLTFKYDENAANVTRKECFELKKKFITTHPQLKNVKMNQKTKNIVCDLKALKYSLDQQNSSHHSQDLQFSVECSFRLTMFTMLFIALIMIISMNLKINTIVDKLKYIYQSIDHITARYFL